MRAPVLHTDGWCLEDGEQRNREAPATFQIPDLDVRKVLRPGDMTKLIFVIVVAGIEAASVERMWVIARKRGGECYLGILNNDPYSIAENEALWSGTELPFEPRHIIDVRHGNAASIAIALQPAVRPWR